MTRTGPRTGFNSSGLIRLLAGFGLAGAAPAAGGNAPSFAERLSQWFDYLDAIALASALQAPAGGAAGPAAALAEPDALGDELARLRAGLAASLRGDGPARTALPPPGATDEAARDFAPYRRYLLARQREMESAVGPLRARARAALAGQSPALARLAGLDAAFDETLGGRERSLLATVPVLLEQRFEQLAAAPADAAAWRAPGGGLARFRADLRNVLLAELEIRLQPVLGLLEALRARVSIGAETDLRHSGVRRNPVRATGIHETNRINDLDPGVRRGDEDGNRAVVNDSLSKELTKSG